MTCGFDDSDSGGHTSVRIDEHGEEPATLALPCSILVRVCWSNGFCAVNKVPRPVVARVFAGCVANTLNVNGGAARNLLVSNCRVEGKRAHNCKRCKKHSLSGKSCRHLTRIDCNLQSISASIEGSLWENTAS